MATGAAAPFASPMFRLLWLAGLGSNIGTFTQTLAAAWVMTSLTDDAALVAALQAAAMLPAFALALPAGALADVVDQRRLLVATQAWMLASAAALGAATLAGAVTPTVLLALTVSLGIGSALSLPAYVALTPALVPRPQLQAASALNTVSINIAQAAGPALAGVVIASLGPAWAFLLNAVSFTAVIAAIMRWRPPARVMSVPAERVFGAMRTGLGFVRSSPGLRSVLWRALAYFVPASAPGALLPLVGRGRLDLSPVEFGLVFAVMGIGALAGAAALPRVSARLGPDARLVAATVTVAAGTAGTALATGYAALCLAVGVAGFGGVTASATLNATAQSVLSPWVRGRGLAVYLLTFQAGLAVGALAWGALAGAVGTGPALLASAGLLLVFAIDGVRHRLSVGLALDVSAIELPAYTVTHQPADDDGPVLVSLEYDVDPADHGRFAAVMADVRDVRRRTGAYGWSLVFDLAAPTRVVESYHLHTWADYVRQRVRATASDGEAVQRAYAIDRRSYPIVTRHLDLSTRTREELP